jgi:hypothetical protein
VLLSAGFVAFPCFISLTLSHVCIFTAGDELSSDFFDLEKTQSVILYEVLEKVSRLLLPEYKCGT